MPVRSTRRRDGERRTRITVTVGLVVISLALAACSTTSPKESVAKAPKKATLTAVKVIWQPAGDFGFYYANAHNIWQKFGLKIIPTEIVTGTEELAAMASNSDDIAYMGIPPGITGVAKGIPMVGVTAGPDEAELDGLYVPQNSPIKTLSDIVGKTIGVPKDSTANVDMYLALEKAGIPWNSVKVDYMNPPELLPAISKGDIQGAWVWDAWGQILEGAGNRLVVPAAHYGVADAALWWVQKSFLRKNPTTVAKFIEALTYSATMADKKPGTAVSQYEKLANLTSTEALTIWRNQPAANLNMLTRPSSPLAFTDTSSNTSGIRYTIQQAAKALVALGDLSSSAATTASKEAIDTVPMKQALQILKSYKLS